MTCVFHIYTTYERVRSMISTIIDVFIFDLTKKKMCSEQNFFLTNGSEANEPTCVIITSAYVWTTGVTNVMVKYMPHM